MFSMIFHEIVSFQIFSWNLKMVNIWHFTADLDWPNLERQVPLPFLFGWERFVKNKKKQQSFKCHTISPMLYPSACGRWYLVCVYTYKNMNCLCICVLLLLPQTNTNNIPQIPHDKLLRWSQSNAHTPCLRACTAFLLDSNTWAVWPTRLFFYNTPTWAICKCVCFAKCK